MSMLLRASLVLSLACLALARKPNLLFIIAESTDAKAYFSTNPDDAPMQLPNIRRLQARGTTLNQHYVAAPVCCPSRAAIWSGRDIHNIAHRQESPRTGLHVAGAWNNHEGLPPGYNRTFADVFQAAGYAYSHEGKLDYSAGGHSVDARVTAWTNKVDFPYTLANGSYGWYDEDGPVTKTLDTNETRAGDWKAVRTTAKFIEDKEQEGEPWLAYLATDIAHPPYVAGRPYLDALNRSKITVPKWKDISEMHPEDFRASMLKKMGSTLCCSDDDIINIRAHYYAMILEYDRMIGVVLDAVDASGAADYTYIVATSDHGDMNAEHRQYYKMSPYDASSRVPLIIAGPHVQSNVILNTLTSSLDFYPTFMAMGGLEPPSSVSLDGHSLMPLLVNGSDPTRPSFVVSQFHGDEIHLSWFLVRHQQWKYVTYGNGQQVAPHLFNMDTDPLEDDDLGTTEKETVAQLDRLLRSYIDYPRIASEVESYNKDSFVLWRNSIPPSQFNKTISQLRWKNSWAYDPAGCLAAIDHWLTTPNATIIEEK